MCYSGLLGGLVVVVVSCVWWVVVGGTGVEVGEEVVVEARLGLPVVHSNVCVGQSSNTTLHNRGVVVV